jgi:hypothetical protein
MENHGSSHGRPLLCCSYIVDLDEDKHVHLRRLQNPNHKPNTSWALVIKSCPSHEAQKDLNHKKMMLQTLFMWREKIQFMHECSYFEFIDRCSLFSLN